MKEITRVHIAKVAYDIEVPAKKAIEKYIGSLERYADDPELLTDIEIRITELLAERGVLAGGVIGTDDIAAVRAQLGEPADFLPEGAGDIAVGASELDGPAKRVYRDIDNAALAGVLAGFAKFFDINVLWLRLVFIVLLFASFGTVLMIYGILWLAIPPARTAAEKLRMQGKPVTLESIKQLGEAEQPSGETARIMRRILRYGAGVVLLIGAIGTLFVTLFIGSGLVLGATDTSPIAGWRPMESGWLVAAFILFILAGLLLAALMVILAMATLRLRWSRRIGTTVIAIIAGGLLLFGGGVGTVWYGSWQENTHYNQLRKTTGGALPANFAQVASVTFASTKDRPSTYVAVEYIVSDKMRYELDALPGVTPHITVADDGSASVRVDAKNERSRPFAYWGDPVLRIYGPSLEAVTIESGRVHYYNEAEQDTLRVAGKADSFSLAGSYKTVQVESSDGADISLGDSAIEALDVAMNGGRVTAGVVLHLTVTAAEACPAREQNDEQNRVVVQAVSSGKMVYNATEQAAKTVIADCGSVIVGREYMYNEKEE